METPEELKRVIFLNQQAIFLLRKQAQIPDDQIERSREAIRRARRDLWGIETIKEAV